MFRIDSNNNVFMTRGDDVSLTISILNADGSAYTMAATDTLTLTTRTSYNAQSAAFTVMSTGTNVITISSATTASVPFGSYVYDIELYKAADTSKHTIIGQDGINNPVWRLLEDVTR